MIATQNQTITMIRQIDLQDPTVSFAQDVLSGLTKSPKRLSSVYFYDTEGSLLFEKICELDEYYLTRKETEILNESAAEIIATLTPGSHLIELGSGSSTKTRILLEAAIKQYGTTQYSPIDVSEDMLYESAADLQGTYGNLRIEAIAGFYEFGLEHILRGHQTPKCVMWLGSSIGNLTRLEAAAFLGDLRKKLNQTDRVLLGIDLRKAADVLEPAYDDSKGITADFNLNLLKRVNRELKGGFELEAFKHRSVYNELEGRIEMYLDSQVDQNIFIELLQRHIHFKKGEAILTEYSYKYSGEEILNLARSAGYDLEHQWLDQDGMFSLNLFKPT